MVYECKKYGPADQFGDLQSTPVIQWETDEILDERNPRFCGKLISYVCNDPAVTIPDGIETLGYSFLVPPGAWGSPAETVHIPASVKVIEEGAFAYSDVAHIVIDPESPCGIVKHNGLFTKDGKTLLWILGSNHETAEDAEYIVPDGVERIGIDACSGNGFGVLVVPGSVTHIGFNEENDFFFLVATIKAPKGSYAIEFAKAHNMKFEEIG